MDKSKLSKQKAGDKFAIDFVVEELKILKKLSLEKTYYLHKEIGENILAGKWY